MSMDHQLLLLFAGRNGYLDRLSLEQVNEFKEIIADIFELESVENEDNLSIAFNHILSLGDDYSCQLSFSEEDPSSDDNEELSEDEDAGDNEIIRDLILSAFVLEIVELILNQ